MDSTTSRRGSRQAPSSSQSDALAAYYAPLRSSGGSDSDTEATVAGPEVRGYGSGRLGNTTNFTDKNGGKESHPQRLNRRSREVFDTETGEIKSFLYDPRRESWNPSYDEDASKLERWMLLRHSQRVLSRPGYWENRLKQSKAAYTDLRARVSYSDIQTRKACSMLAVDAGVPLVRNKHHDIPDSLNKAPTFRVVSCYRRKRSKEHTPELWRSKDTGNVSWHNVAVCGSVWTCPICALKINMARREEIRRCYEAIRQVDGRAYMLTFTIKHGIGDALADLVEKFKAAQQHFQKSYAFKEVTRKAPLKRPRPDSVGHLGYIGRIANLEVTHGDQHGWHPHEHHLWFFDRDMSPAQMVKVRDRLFSAWAEACEAVGLPAPRKTVKVGGTVRFVGLDIRPAYDAQEYLTKYGAQAEDTGRRWGPEKEMASSHAKQARAKGRTPFQLLADSVSDDDPRAAHRWCEFAEAFLGRHQLQFSRSLKAFLRAHDISIDETEGGDQLHAEMAEDDAVQLGELTDVLFDRVVRNHAQGEVLVFCRHHGFERTVEFIRSLPGADLLADVEYHLVQGPPAPRRTARPGRSTSVDPLAYELI